MEYIVESDGSKRYLVAKDRELLESEEYLFGCEFEFYPNEKYNQEHFIERLCLISQSDVVVNDIFVPSFKNATNYMQLKPDISLDSNGLEISTPICSYDKLMEYIIEINSLIEQYGYTNDDTGLHIHISKAKKDGVNFDFYKFALLCNDRGLLDRWGTRNGYCINVMSVINYNTKRDSKVLKNKKGRVWNLELVSKNRVEIRTMGGMDYHLKNREILQELTEYRDIFRETLDRDTQAFRALKREHLEMVKSASDEEKIGFMKLFFRND